MNKEQNTSLSLSKRLAENVCEIESDFGWVKWKGQKKRWSFQDIFIVNNYDGDYPGIDITLPAYDLLWDICVKYRKEFFGDETIYKCFSCGLITKKLKENCDEFSDCYSIYNDGYGEYDGRLAAETEIARRYYAIPESCLTLLQRGKKQKAEDLIWEHCKFNPKNK